MQYTSSVNGIKFKNGRINKKIYFIIIIWVPDILEQYIFKLREIDMRVCADCMILRAVVKLHVT